VLVTNDHLAGPATLETEHRHKAQVEAGMRELRATLACPRCANGFMANWAWLLLVCLGHNLCCWAQSWASLVGGRDGGDLHAKRFRTAI
jgi:hypothetical protein